MQGLEAELEEWRRTGLEEMEDKTELRLKGLIRDWERRLAAKELQHTQVQ